MNFELMYALAEHSQEPMLLSSSRGDILYVNPAFCELVGQRREAVLEIGSAGWMHLLAETREIKEHLRADGRDAKLEANLWHKSGQKIPVELVSRSFSTSENHSYISVHVRDLRAQKDAHQKLEAQQQELKKAVRELQLVMDFSADLICTFSPDGEFLHVNKACLAILGYTPEELIGRNYRAFIHPEDHAITEQDAVEVIAISKTLNFKNRYLHKDGSTIYLSWSSSLVREENKIYCIGRNISNEVANQAKDKHNEYRLQALLQEGQDMVCILDKEGSYSFVSGSVIHAMGYDPQELIGRKPFEFIHPDDVVDILDEFEQVSAGMDAKTPPFRFKTKAGEWRWLETKGVNCFHHPAINGIIVNSRDITERLQAQRQLELSEKMYKAVFEKNPDFVYSLSPSGYFTSVNAAAISCIGYSEEEFLKMRPRDLLHPDKLKEAEENFVRIKAGESMTTETTVFNANGNKVHLAVTKVPVIVNGELIGVHGIAKDITAVKRQQRLLKDTANRLKNILESIKDAFFTLDKDWCFTYMNHQFEKSLGVKSSDLIGRDVREVFPSERYQKFYAKFQRAFSLQHPTHFEEYSYILNEWLDVSAYPSEEGLSVFIKGVSARKQVEAELKKLSLVASKTVNSVYITDDEARVEWVNDGFTRLTGYTLEEIKGRKPGDLLAGPETNLEKVSVIRQKLNYDKPFVQEVQNRSKSGEVYWSKLDVTPIIDDLTGGKKKFIVIETDITEQKRAEEERTKLTEELLRRNRHLEQFTYIVSHNLRSPVANIIGLTSLLSTSDNPDMQKGIITKLKQTSQNLDYIIRDLNEMLSLQAGVLEEREKIMLPTVIEQVLQELPLDGGSTIRVELNGVGEIGSIRSYVSSIISNLLTNAVKYKSPDRPLCLTIQAEHHQTEGMVCLMVTDNGLGINLKKRGQKPVWPLQTIPFPCLWQRIRAIPGKNPSRSPGRICNR
ncbi:PAS domain S-box protein [Rufibacter sp. H-1]|uniref:histidine kinase n=1 Tax=Rufibacter sediminis TaxID=2762756 RepID=A0ABR6VW91_9BACT|nr:PAS domain S-box protein [Rufibacter sediminis]